MCASVAQESASSNPATRWRYLRRCRGPKAERSIHVNPRTGRAGSRDNGTRWIECACVDVSGLQAQNRALIEMRHRVCAHASLSINRNTDDAFLAQPEHRQRLQHRGMRFLSNNDLQLRRAEKAIRFDIPSGALEKFVTRRCERRKIGHGRAGHHSTGCPFRQPEQFARPFHRRIFQLCSPLELQPKARHSGPMY